jgi:hypothetical protein
MTDIATFTIKQLDDFRAFEALRRSGKINMFDARAAATVCGLSRTDYCFVVQNYGALKKEATPAPPVAVDFDDVEAYRKLIGGER